MHVVWLHENCSKLLTPASFIVDTILHLYCFFTKVDYRQSTYLLYLYIPVKQCSVCFMVMLHYQCVLAFFAKYGLGFFQNRQQINEQKNILLLCRQKKKLVSSVPHFSKLLVSTSKVLSSFPNFKNLSSKNRNYTLV